MRSIFSNVSTTSKTYYAPIVSGFERYSVQITSTKKQLSQFVINPKKQAQPSSPKEAVDKFSGSVGYSPLAGVAPADKPHSRTMAWLGGLGLGTAGGVTGQMVGGHVGMLVGAVSGLAGGAFAGKKAGDYLYGMNLPEILPPDPKDESAGQKAIEAALSSPVEGHSAGKRTLNRIKGVVLAGLSDLEPGELRSKMKERYQTMRLMDKQGNWTVPSLEKHERVLLPDDISKPELRGFVDSMASSAEKNQYLMKFLKKAENQPFKSLRSKVETEGARVFKEAMSFAQVLDRLTQVMIDEPEINGDCREHWKENVDSNPNFWGVQHIFEKYKTSTINLLWNTVDKERENGGQDNGLVSFGSKMDFLLRLNIAEAGAVGIQQSIFGDSRVKESCSACSKVAGVLNKNSTGEGSSRLSEDHKTWEIHPKSVKEWNDLYAVWNMQFVTHHPIGVIGLTKLLVPSVNNYEEKPEAYIHNRALALNSMMYLNGMARADGTDLNLDWRDPDMTNLWAKSNLESASEYEALAKSKA